MSNGTTPFNAELETCSLSELFNKPLQIPPYQRSYSWGQRHVEDLLKDISARKTPYLMGTVILDRTLENDKECLDIVDGQQRLVTLTVLWHVLNQDNNSNHSLPLLTGMFSVGAAKLIRETQKVINTFLAVRTDDEKNNLREMLTTESASDSKPHLKFYVLTLSGKDTLDRAYTFFDSVNSKGKPLSDFDLLKAHHLMFIPSQQESVASVHNTIWSNRRDDDREKLFSWMLRRIRMWSRGKDRDAQSERPDYDEFSSVVEPAHEEETEHLFNRYMQPAAFRSWRREGDKIILTMDYPTPDGEKMLPMEITQTLEGGDSFFLYAQRYHELYDTLYGTESQSTRIEFLHGLAGAMNNDYLSNAFKAVMLLYADKFGEDRLIEVSICVERIISAWRWEKERVYIGGTLTHVKKQELVPILLESANSRHALEQLLAKAHAANHLLPQKQTTGKYRTPAQEHYRRTVAKFYAPLLQQNRISDSRIQTIAKFTETNA